MKKILLFLLVSTVVFGQEGKVAKTIRQIQTDNGSFIKHSLFSVQSNYNHNPVKNAPNATVALLDLNEVNAIVQGNTDYIEFDIPYNGELLPVVLYKVTIQTADYKVNTDKIQNITVEKGVHYRGIIKSDINSLASFNFYNNQMSGIISNGKYKNLVIGKLNNSGNISDYIIYSDADLQLKQQFECKTVDIAPAGIQPKTVSSTLLSQKCVTVYFEIQYSIFVANGSNAEQTAIWMDSVFNNVQTLFNNDGISVAIKSVFIWTTPDPYIGGTMSTDYLYQFHDLRPVFDGDIGQLIGIDDNNLGGIAAVSGGLCSDNNFSYCDLFFSFENLPAYSWTVYVITHELGHLMGSEHTHGCYWNGNNTAIDGCATTVNPAYAEGSCPIAEVPSETVGGTIMSYCHLLSSVGINFANGFGPQPAARILQKIESAVCLGTDCINTCISMVTSVNTSEITNTSAKLFWTDENTEAVSWEIAVIPYPFEPSNTDWIVSNTNPFLATDLTPNTYYKFLVRPACGSAFQGTPKAIYFATSDDFCAGRPFLDTGGSANNYESYENWTRTIVPINSNDKIKVSFNSIDIEDGYDFLYIYNGQDMDAPLLTTSGITGSTVVGPFESTDISGALTFHFNSDTNTVGAGWDANFSCSSLGIEENDFVDFSYYPNPVKNILTINSKNEIWNINVYSMDGRLLYNDSKRQLGSVIDMSEYAVGTYVIKLAFEGRSVTFRLLRAS